MNLLPPSIENLIESFSSLPGIGPKSAARIVFFLLKHEDIHSKRLARNLLDMKERVVYCKTCFNITQEDLCSICKSSDRDDRIICVVGNVMDVLAIEKAHSFKGVYHVLHGEISPMHGLNPDDLMIDQLEERVRVRQADERPLEEIIIATNPTSQGETTALYLARLLHKYGVPMSRLARGLPSGGDLEYADHLTLENALQNRVAFS